MPTWAILLIIFPIVCAVIGYATNVIAVKMIFRPHRAVRVGPVILQGVLPKHQAHFAAMLAGIIVREFVTTGELVSELHTDEAVDAVEREARALATDLVDEIRELLPPGRQAFLAPAMVDALTDQIARAFREELPTILETIAAKADEIVDLEALVTDKFIAIGPQGLEDVIYEVSRRELIFIELYGGVFGALLGVFQLLVLQLLGNIALPLVGALVGTVTNWLAIQMLFYPRQPKTYLGVFRYQGMFPRRQNEIAASMGHIAARQFIVPTEIFGRIVDALLPRRLEPDHLTTGEAWLRAHIPPMGQALDAVVTPDERDRLTCHICERSETLLPAARDRLLTAAADAVDVDTLLTTKVSALDKTGFETLLRGLFEREELYLIIYGGVLGGAMGLAQLAIVNVVG